MTDKFFSDLKALGVEVVKGVNTQAPPNLLLGVEQTKDVVAFIAIFASNVVNKESLLTMEIGSALINAVVGADKIIPEVKTITEEGIMELYDTAVQNLEFVADKKKIEALAEKILLGSFQILLGIMNFSRA